LSDPVAPDPRRSARTLVHFGVFSLERRFWELDEGGQADVAGRWAGAFRAAADTVRFYRTFGQREDSDALVWCSVRGDAEAPARFFQAYAGGLQPVRRYVRLAGALWGLTGESPYARDGSARGIDPFGPPGARYVVVYPFVKTPGWYALPDEERRRMMSEHIRVGRAHTGIDQLLLYATGLQDHEFVVVYETDDLAAFSDLVGGLRRTEARGYTLRDTPVHVGVLVEGDGAATLARPRQEA